MSITSSLILLAPAAWPGPLWGGGSPLPDFRDPVRNGGALRDPRIQLPGPREPQAPLEARKPLPPGGSRKTPIFETPGPGQGPGARG